MSLLATVVVSVVVAVLAAVVVMAVILEHLYMETMAVWHRRPNFRPRNRGFMAAVVWAPIHEPHMHGRDNTCLLLRVVVDPCARDMCTHVYPVVHAFHLHCPSYSSRSISYSPQFSSPSCKPHFLAIHGVDVEPIIVSCQSSDVLLVVLSLVVH